MLMLKRLVLAFACVIGLGAVAYAALWVLLIMALSGTWPFNPLARRSEQLNLDNGGTIAIEGIEDRGFGSDGFLFNATYLSAADNRKEKIGSWIGHEWNSEAYALDELIVFVNPDRKKLHVRSSEGDWKTFHMSFPGPESPVPISRYVTATTLNEQSLAELQYDLTEEERRYAPNAYIESFDPDRMQLTVSYLTTADIRRTLALGLSNDGSELTLRGIKKEIVDGQTEFSR